MTGPLQPNSRPITRVSAVASVCLIAVGSFVLAGWTLGITELTTLTGSISMKANAAIGLLASGIALGFVHTQHRVLRAAGRTGAVLASVLGASTLIEHVTGLNLRIDELLFSEPPGAAATASPNRMGPNSSTSLTLAGLALWSLYRSTRRAIVMAQMLGASVAVLALVPIVGYLYGATELYTIARLTGIAPHTGVSLFILALGILAARYDAGPVSALMSDAPHGVMARRLLVPAMVVPLVLGYLRVLGERRGLYDTGLGASMFVVAAIVLLSVTIWRTAVALQAADTARESAEAALTETEHRFRSLADQAPVLIWVEEGGARVWFNRRWFEFTGAAPGAREWRTLLHEEDWAGYQASRQAAAAIKASYSHQYRLRRSDGSFAWVLETAIPRRSGGEAADYVGSCVDVTELHEARDKAERADRAKDQFIAALSHELRTPLNAIVGWMQMLERGTLADHGREKATAAVARNAASLARLIEDLLDTSRIAAGHLDLSPSQVDVTRVVQAAVESVMPSAEARGVGIVVAARSDLPPVFADAQRLQQVVWNLLSNAIKFTPDGGRVEIDLSSSPDSVEIQVRDQGTGIDPAFMPFLFDRFRQGDSSLTRAHGGLGLGLYIARHLVQLHGGELAAFSRGPGTGAVFTVRLPAAIARAAAS